MCGINRPVDDLVIEYILSKAVLSTAISSAPVQGVQKCVLVLEPTYDVHKNSLGRVQEGQYLARTLTY